MILTPHLLYEAKAAALAQLQRDEAHLLGMENHHRKLVEAQAKPPSSHPFYNINSITYL